MNTKSTILGAGLLLCTMVSVNVYAQFVPDDAKPTCTVTESELEGWFDASSIGATGIVSPPDGLTFDDSTDCNFYKWSWQMFLWAISPTKIEEGGTWVFDGKDFFDLESDGTLNNDSNLNVRAEKTDREGQAGGSATLMSQARAITGNSSGSLIYYGIHINDVYAYFNAGQTSGVIEANEFPTTQDQLNAITDYASKYFGVDIRDDLALTLEIKTSWVAVGGDADTSDYITIDAQIPTYDTSSDTSWTENGTEDATLAMVGMHVVASVAGHPEMVWASFEQVNNTPNASYTYENSSGAKVTVDSFNSGGTPLQSGWLLMSDTGNEADANIENMTYDSSTTTITAETDKKISPSDTVRENPWGTDNDTETNTDIISINDSIISQLAAGDVRSNYALIGALWTNDGEIPPSSTFTTNQTGSTKLANATMETYNQDDNCFSCHNGDPLSGLSHIWDDITPLTPPTTD